MRYPKALLFLMMLAIVTLPYLCSELAGEENEAEMRSTTPVVRRTFRPELFLDGYLAPSDAEVIRVHLEEFEGKLVIKYIAESGSIIKAGDILIEIDSEPIDQLIEKVTLQYEKEKLSLENYRTEMEVKRETAKRDLEQSRLAYQDAQENRKDYLEISWPLEIEKAELNIRRQEARLEDEKAELAELEKMYEEAELAGRTKEIVLERARRDVEISAKLLELSRRDWAFARERKHPRQLRDLENAEKWARQAVDFKEKEAVLSAAEQELLLKSKEQTVENLRRRLERLHQEKSRFTVTATTRGIVVHGDLMRRLSEGKPAGLSPLHTIKERDTVQPGGVLLTIYSGEKFHAMVAVKESDWSLVKPGMQAFVRFTAFPGKKFAGKVSRIAALPDGTGKDVMTFSTEIEIESPTTLFCPGLTCEVEFVLDEIQNALVIPRGAVFEQEGRSFCHVRTEHDHIKREIFIGGKSGDYVWVVSGLEEGEEVVLRK